jgi:hypothetical protein
MKMNTILVQDLAGNWIEARFVAKMSDQYLRRQMVDVQKNFGGKRVKAVDDKGHLIDII